MKTSENIEKQAIENPLMRKHVKWESQTWEEWKSEFRMTSNAFHLMELIHQGFNMESHGDEYWEDRIITYICLAHGHSNARSFKFEDEEYKDRHRDDQRDLWAEGVSLAYTRQELAKLALARLANFFHECYTDKPDRCGYFVRHLSVIEHLLMFFGDGREHPSNPFVPSSNLNYIKDERYKEWVFEFYAQFAEKLVCAKQVLDKYTIRDEQKAKVLNHLPRLQYEGLRILIASECTDAIIRVAPYVLPEAVNMVERAMKKLRFSELVTGNWRKGTVNTNYNVPKSIDEAIKEGSYRALMCRVVKQIVGTKGKPILFGPDSRDD